MLLRTPRRAREDLVRVQQASRARPSPVVVSECPVEQVEQRLGKVRSDLDLLDAAFSSLNASLSMAQRSTGSLGSQNRLDPAGEVGPDVWELPSATLASFATCTVCTHLQKPTWFRRPSAKTSVFDCTLQRTEEPGSIPGGTLGFCCRWTRARRRLRSPFLALATAHSSFAHEIQLWQSSPTGSSWLRALTAFFLISLLILLGLVHSRPQEHLPQR